MERFVDPEIYRDFPVIVLGSTGSVGRQTLDVAQRCGLRVEGISGSRNLPLLEEQVRRFRPRWCAVASPDLAKEFRGTVADTDTEILSGEEGVLWLAENGDASLCFNSISGTAGLRPTLDAIRSGKNVALANKETLVTAGEWVMREAKEHGVSVLPVDSEHSAIFQCLRGEPHSAVRSLILTCSGGPFFGRDRDSLSRVTPEEALAHPTWKMGKKITVDCATLMNKGLELIEAVRLFGVSPEQVEIVIHRESIVHSMVRFCDGAVKAQLSNPDMRLCIQYALTCPERIPGPVEELDLTRIGALHFEHPDEATFKLLPLAREAVVRGGVKPAALNGANEAAVALFLDGKISLTELFDLVETVVREAPETLDPDIETLLAADRSAREAAYRTASVPYPG